MLLLDIWLYWRNAHIREMSVLEKCLYKRSACIIERVVFVIERHLYLKMHPYQKGVCIREMFILKRYLYERSLYCLRLLFLERLRQGGAS